MSQKYHLVLTREAEKDAKKIKGAGLKEKVETILDLLKTAPFHPSPPYEKLTGTLKGLYSRRITIQHRLVYAVHEKEREVRILRMWSHYEGLP